MCVCVCVCVFPSFFAYNWKLPAYNGVLLLRFLELCLGVFLKMCALCSGHALCNARLPLGGVEDVGQYTVPLVVENHVGGVLGSSHPKQHPVFLCVHSLGSF